jgi:hypothetical protein
MRRESRFNMSSVPRYNGLNKRRRTAVSLNKLEIRLQKYRIVCNTQ